DSIKQVRELIEGKMNAVNGDLAEANARLAQYKQQTGLIDLSAQLTQTTNHLATLQGDQEAAIEQFNANAQQLAVLRSKLAALPVKVINDTTFTHDPRYMDTLTTLNNLHDERAKLLGNSAADSEVKAVDKRIADAEARLKSLANATIVSEQQQGNNPLYADVARNFLSTLVDQAGQNARLASIQRAIRAVQVQGATLPQKERQLTELMQKVSMLTTSYQSLAQQYQDLSISEEGMLPSGSVVSMAQANTTPVSPRPLPDIALFGAFGLLLALLVTAIVERFDERLHSQQAIEHISPLDTLAVLPKLKSGEAHLITAAAPFSSWLESFRILRHSLAFSISEQALKVLAVTSPQPGDGKTTVCANLAIAMAMDGKRVLAVDLDLRRPTLHKTLSAMYRFGVTDVVSGTIKLHDAIVPTDIDGLSFLGCGKQPSNPPEFLNSVACRQMIHELASAYDVVVLDCPPAAGLSDMQAIAAFADSALLVTAAGETMKANLEQAITMLNHAHIPLPGMVVNRVDKLAVEYGYGDYYRQELPSEVEEENVSVDND
ncbi:MAG TPA: polysaccharide biosynthesis tyrosine autokinase, partial [Armatimonadota bacterium]|nr:polysaccharide biosynthesis tyrosine autokinase [Armatimonadota bacterium]